MAQLCDEFHEWVEEKIEKKVTEWQEKRVEKCKRRKCKKWCLCCNKWFCWIEIVLVAVTKFIFITVLKWVLRVVCWTVNIIIDALAGIISMIFFIPIIGRLLRQIWDGILELFWRLVGSLGAWLDIFGLDIRKKLRICIIILRDEKGVELTNEATLQPIIQDAKQIWKSAANVKLVVEDIHTIEPNTRFRNLDVDCETGAWTDDLLATGSNFELIANTYCFDGVGRRLLGYAAPIVVFMVRSIGSGKKGCSLGIFSDYVTLEAGDPSCLAHELGHANYLYWKQHHDESDNLMYSSCGGTKLKKWQKIIMRNSRHITYL